MRVSKTVAIADAALMLPAEDLFVYVYVLIDDLVAERSSRSHAARVRRLPAATPSCSAATPRTPNGSTTFRLAIKTDLAAASSVPGVSSSPPSTNVTSAMTC